MHGCSGMKQPNASVSGMRDGPARQHGVERIAQIVNGDDAPRLAERGVLVVDAAAVFHDARRSTTTACGVTVALARPAIAPIAVDDGGMSAYRYASRCDADARGVDRHVFVDERARARPSRDSPRRCAESPARSRWKSGSRSTTKTEHVRRARRREQIAQPCRRRHAPAGEPASGPP